MIALLLLTLSAIEPHPSSTVAFAQLKYAGGAWNPRPNAIRRLSFEIEKRTSIITTHEATPVAATDARLVDMPFMYWAGDGAMAPLDGAQVAALRRYVKAGGVIFIDCVDEAFEASVKKELLRILPESPLGLIPEEHV